jgi:hypothetical protein
VSGTPLTLKDLAVSNTPTREPEEITARPSATREVEQGTTRSGNERRRTHDRAEYESMVRVERGCLAGKDIRYVVAVFLRWIQIWERKIG